MHDIKFIKENPDNFEKSLKKRNCIVDSKKLIDLHNSYLESLNKVQNYQEKKNSLSKKVSSINDKSSEEFSKISKEVKTLKADLELCKEESLNKKKILDQLLSEISPEHQKGRPFRSAGCRNYYMPKPVSDRALWL